jgi:hypothetical protein
LDASQNILNVLSSDPDDEGIYTICPEATLETVESWFTGYSATCYDIAIIYNGESSSDVEANGLD